MSQVRREMVRARLPGRPSSVGVARRLLRSTDPTLGDADVDTAELLVSELVTNAVVHAGTPVDIVVSVVADATLQVEVSDGSGGLPTNRPGTKLSSRGRGLLLLDALSDCWGVRSTTGGKTVWFQLRRATAGRDAPVEPGRKSA